MRKFVSKIGGQAVLEGVMMRGERSVATAVRTSDGRIELETSRFSEEKKWWQKVPVLRGFLNFFSMMIIGSRVLTRSAELYGEDTGEPGKFELWLAEKTKKSAMDIAIVIGVFLGVLFAIGLFVALPLGVTTLLNMIPGVSLDGNSADLLRSVPFNLTVSAVRLLVLFSYLLLVSLIPDIKRVFMYHGAEHKVITCFEQGEELTVENARKMSRQHDRCGTSFLVITVFVSVLASAFLPAIGFYQTRFGWGRFVSFLVVFSTRLALLPFVAGLSYEVLKGLAKFDNAFVRVLKKPGLWFQKLTTREPDDSMLEVSLTAFKTVQAMDADPAIETVTFHIKKSYPLVRRETLSLMKNVDEKETLADWIFVSVLKKTRSELPLTEMISQEEADLAKEYAKKIGEGTPLQYALGETEFYGVTLKTDPRALIPRGDTEVLVEEALKVIRDGDRVLDICTGSGAIAIALALKSGAEVSASDNDPDALDLAKENVEFTGAKVNLFLSDLFDSAEGVFDVVTANPPYIPTSEYQTLSDFVKKEPVVALVAGEDGLDYYRRIAESVSARLKEGGVLLMEIGCDQAQAVSDLFAPIGKVDVISDLEGHDRVVKVTKNV